MKQGRLQVLAAGVAAVFVLTRTAYANDSNSKSDSGNSSGNSGNSSGNSNSNSQSNDSKNSSNDSHNSSHNSDQSSKDSDNSTKNSPGDSTKNSSDGTTNDSKDSSNASTKNNGAKVATIAGAILLVAAAIAIGISIGRGGSSSSKKAAESKLTNYLRKNHPMVAHDILLADGPVLRTWATDLGLSESERERFFAVLDGSEEQTVMLEAINSDLDDVDVERFSAAFVEAARRALGDRRLAAVATGAIGASGS